MKKSEREIEGVAFTFALFATSLPLAAPLKEHRHVYIQRKDSDHSTPLVFSLPLLHFLFLRTLAILWPQHFVRPFLFLTFAFMS